MGPAEMRQIAAWIDEVTTAVAKGDEEALAAVEQRVAGEVRELTKNFPTPGLDR